MIDFDLTGKTAIVSGASKGIGRAIAEMLLGLNCNVIITSTKASPAWYKKFKGCQHRIVDFLNKNSIDKFLAEIDSIIDIDILVNNAGIYIPEAIFALSDTNWEKVLQINLCGPMQLMRKVGQKMKSVKKGKIVNISSIAGIVSKPGSGAYSASKSGLIGLTRASALDLAPYNVLVNALCPGPTLTDMLALLTEGQREQIKNNIPLKKFAKPKEIASFVVFLCSDLNTYITGETIIVDGGATIK